MRTNGIMLPAALAAMLASGVALADTGHGKTYSFGEPGKAAEATRTVEVTGPTTRTG